MESTLCNTVPVSILITSPATGDFLGKFFEEDGILTFEGNVDEAGQVFVNFICNTFNARIDQLINEKNVNDWKTENNII